MLFEDYLDKPLTARPQPVPVLPPTVTRIRKVPKTLVIIIYAVKDKPSNLKY